jgi:hypothetical protein
MSRSRRNSVELAITTGVGKEGKEDFLVASKVSMSAMERRPKRKRKNRMLLTDGQDGEQLGEVSRILLVVTIMGY